VAFSKETIDRARVLFASGLRWQEVQAKIKEETGETVSRHVIYGNSPPRSLSLVKGETDIRAALEKEREDPSSTDSTFQEIIIASFESALELSKQAPDDPKCATASLSLVRQALELKRYLDQKAAVSGEAKTVSNSIDELLGEAERARG